MDRSEAEAHLNTLTRVHADACRENDRALAEDLLHAMVRCCRRLDLLDAEERKGGCNHGQD